MATLTGEQYVVIKDALNRLLELGVPVDALERIEDWLDEAMLCGQCGERLTTWACGPSHALLRQEAGLEWDGVEV